MKPPTKMTVSEWAEKKRIVSRENSSVSGRWSNNYAPYQKGIMDAINIKGVEEIVVMASSQIGKTETELNAIGYFIDQDPTNLMVVLPTLDAAQTWSKERLNSMIRDNPSIRGKVNDENSRDSDNTILNKKFDGGRITLCGANSPTSLASRPVRVIIFDEVSKYSESASNEGDPISLAKERANTYYNKLFFMVSTPNELETCRINAEFELTDKRKYFIPCPHCSFKQTLEWDNMRWDIADFKSAYMVCKSCEGKIFEHHKRTFLANGEWIPTVETNNNKKIGFHISALYSPNTSFEALVQKYEESKSDVLKAKVFVNASLGLPWHEAQEKIEFHQIHLRRENYSAEIPEGVLLLCAGVDVQDDRLCVEVVGFGNNSESWSIDYLILWGDPDQKEVWNDLDALRHRRFVHDAGFPMRIASMAIDSGGHHTSTVYNYCKLRQGSRVFAVKGFAGFGRAVVGAVSRRKSGQDERNCDLFPVGTEVIKMLLYEQLKQQKVGAGYCHFPKKEKYNERFFEELTSENIELYYSKGVPIKRFVLPRGKRNEVLDCRVYAIAALNVISVDWEALTMNIDAKKTSSSTANDVVNTKENNSGNNYLNDYQRQFKRMNSYVNKW